MKSDAALEQARRELMPLADKHDFEIELSNGVLNLVFEEPKDTKFVVSPNMPMGQIWVSAMARGYRLGWDAERGEFVLDGETLVQLLERLVRTFVTSG